LLPPPRCVPVGNALRGVPGRRVVASVAIPGTPRRAFPTASLNRETSFSVPPAGNKQIRVGLRCIAPPYIFSISGDAL